MLKEFMAEAAKIEAELLSGKEFPDYNVDPVADGETAIVTIVDPWLKSLFLAYKARAEAANNAKVGLTIEQLSVMSREDLAERGRAAQREFTEFNCLSEMIWTELRLTFSIFDHRIGLRAGWIVIKVEPQAFGLEELPPELVAMLTGGSGPNGGIRIANLPGSGYGSN